MFSLLANLYDYVKAKSERKLTLVALGLDNAGKTTIINSVQGLLDREVSPTFGFQSQTLTEGKYKVQGLRNTLVLLYFLGAAQLDLLHGDIAQLTSAAWTHRRLRSMMFQAART